MEMSNFMLDKHEDNGCEDRIRGEGVVGIAFTGGLNCSRNVGSGKSLSLLRGANGEGEIASRMGELIGGGERRPAMCLLGDSAALLLLIVL
jgi:hypothetical protein